MFSIILTLLGAAITLLPDLLFAQPAITERVHFFTKQSELYRLTYAQLPRYGDQLYAEIGDKLFTIEFSEWEDQLFKEIVIQSDLDQDGYTEILLRVETGSGCCGADLYIVSYREDGFFSVSTSKYFKNFRDVSIIEKRGKKLIKVWQDDTDLGGTSWDQAIGIFIFADGQLQKLSHAQNMAKTAPLVEITSAILQTLPEKYAEQRVRIDGDNWLDKVSCKLRYIERFLDCTVKLTEGGTFKSPRNCKRFAVLETSSNGVQDLGCNRLQRGRFDGELFVWEK